MKKTKSLVLQVMMIALVSLALTGSAFAAPTGKGAEKAAEGKQRAADAQAAAGANAGGGGTSTTDTGTGGTAITDEPSCLENGGVLWISNTCYDVSGNVLN